MARRARTRPCTARGCTIHAAPLRAVVVASVVLALHQGVAAQRSLEPIQVRLSVGGAAMVSRDQVERLGYDGFGAVASGQVGYAVASWLEPQLVLATSAFPSQVRTGGLLAPALGVLIGLPSAAIRPYAQGDLGVGFTGPLIRPVLRASAGVDFRISRALRLGPVFAYGQVLHPNEPGNSTDARFVSLSVSVLFRPVIVPPAPPPRRVTLYERVPAPAPEPALPEDPTEELLGLMEQALPATRVELLAPVLFRFDSDELEPIGVAMLHEVARELTQREELELIEIQGYSDARGDPEYNLELSLRRAQRVRDFLVERGVEPARLQIAARGASEPVEAGEAEQHYEQNRRVVFRVLRVREAR